MPLDSTTLPRAQPALCMVMSYPYSLRLWRKLGIHSREMRRITGLGERLGGACLITYDRNEPESDLALGLEAAYNKYGLPQGLYSLLAPLLCPERIRKCPVFMLNQMSGSWTGILAKVFLGCKLVVRNGYFLGQLLRNKGRGRLVLAAVHALEWLTYRMADAIVCTAPPEGVAPVPKGKPLLVQPNGVDTEVFRPLAADKAEGPPVVLAVGRLSEEKNLDGLIKAVQGLKARLVLVGKGREEARLAQLAQTLGVDLELAGVVPNHELPAVIARATVYVMASHHEGNPKALLEAMACGAAVVSTRWGALAGDYVGHGENGLMCGQEPEALRRAIARLLGDEGLRTSLGNAARKTALEHFSLDKVLDREAEFIREALA